MSKIWKVNKAFEEAIKNVMDVTKASQVTIDFNQGTATVSAFLSYFGAEIKTKVDGSENDSFDIDGGLLLKAIGGRPGFILEKEDNSNVLKFKLGNTKGEILVRDKSDVNLFHCSEDSMDTMSEAFKTSLFGVFDKLKINSKKVSLDKLDIQMSCKDGELFYFIGDPFYIQLYQKENSGVEGIKTRMLLKYMTIVNKIMAQEENLKIGLSEGVVCVESDNIVLNFPQISFDGDILSIDTLKSYTTDYFKDEPEGVVMFKAIEINDFLNQALAMFDAGGQLTFKSNDGKLLVTIDSEVGKLDKTFEDVKIKGSIDHKLDLSNLKDCLTKLSGTIKLSCYSACVLIKTKEIPELSYILSYNA